MNNDWKEGSVKKYYFKLYCTNCTKSKFCAIEWRKICLYTLYSSSPATLSYYWAYIVYMSIFYYYIFNLIIIFIILLLTYFWPSKINSKPFYIFFHISLFYFKYFIIIYFYLELYNFFINIWLLVIFSISSYFLVNKLYV